MSQVLTSYLNRPKIYTPDDAAFYRKYGDWPASGAGDEYIKALLHFDTNITDLAGNEWTANNTAAVSTAQAKFGAGSLYLNKANNAYLSTVNSADWNPRTGDFTVDAWIYPLSLSGVQGIFTTMQVNSGIGMALRLNANSLNAFLGYGNGGIGILESTISGINAWHHVAYTRATGTVRLFWDGSIVASATGITSDINSTVTPMIGQNYTDNLTYPFNGYIDEFRFSKGIARWTANFTPPAAAY